MLQIIKGIKYIVPIDCAACGEPCGREYPEEVNDIDGGSPGFREGIGENYCYKDDWCCSLGCLEDLLGRWENDPPMVDCNFDTPPIPEIWVCRHPDADDCFNISGIGKTKLESYKNMLKELHAWREEHES